ncbi:MAG: ABC transporter permease, partial [Gammaproteobacteria bacterium]
MSIDMKTNTALKNEETIASEDITGKEPRETGDPSTAQVAVQEKNTLSNRGINFLEVTGLTWGIPVVRLLAGEDPSEQFRQLLKIMGIPVIAFFAFLLIWDGAAAKVQTSL